MIYGYARVSTEGQTLDAQLDALKAAGAEKVFQEKTSGATAAGRKELARLLATLTTGDLVLVTQLDRLARSTRDLLNLLATIGDKGATFRSLGEAWADTTTAQGRLMLTVIGGIAEFERHLIAKRTTEGRTRAMARGKKMGRKPKLTADQRQEALADLAAGRATQADLARRYNVTPSTITYMVARAE